MRADSLFTSTTINKLDAKRRVSVPATFRNILKADGLNGLYCRKSDTDPGRLDGFGASILEFYQQRLAPKDPLFSEDRDAEATSVFAETRTFQFDDEGRIQLDRDFIEHAGITERVLFVGLGQKFQIWDPERYEKVRAERIARAQAARAANGGAA